MGSLRVGFDKRSKKVEVIRLQSESVRDALRQITNDPKLELYGLHRDQILKIFGKPSRSNAGNHQYNFRANGKRGLVNFICYDHRKKICEEIIKEVGASSVKDMGKVIGELKKTHSDVLDFSKVGSILKTVLK